jgi:two-component system, NarL family, sensor histidine kinase UhpB
MPVNRDVIALDLLCKNDDMDLLIALERERITRDLHDALGQILCSIQLNSEAIKFAVGDNNEDALRLIAAIQSKVKDAHNAVSTIVNEKRPTDVETNIAFKIKKEFLTRLEESPIAIEFGEMDETITLPQVKWKQLYHIVQEVITNIIRHASATKVSVSFYQKNLRLCLVVEDNGIGLPAQSKLSKMNTNGISGIKHRVAMLNGTVLFSNLDFSDDMPGLRVLLSIPH